MGKRNHEEQNLHNNYYADNDAGSNVLAALRILVSSLQDAGKPVLCKP
jgi:hypothetical protein